MTALLNPFGNWSDEKWGYYLNWCMRNPFRTSGKATRADYINQFDVHWAQKRLAGEKK